MKKARVKLKSRTKILGEAVDPNEDAPDTDYVAADAEDDGDSADDGDGDADGAHPLILTRDNTDATESAAALWFSQTQFAGIDDDSDSDDDAGAAAPPIKGKAGRAKAARAAAASAAGGMLSTADIPDFDDEADPVGGEVSDSDSDSEADEKHPDFEEVAASARAPAPSTRQNLDAMGLALAAEMILRKRKREVLDNAYVHLSPFSSLEHMPSHAVASFFCQFRFAC
jgi:hypothetical protein